MWFVTTNSLVLLADRLLTQYGAKIFFSSNRDVYLACNIVDDNIKADI
jgi:hypothetical protein